MYIVWGALVLCQERRISLRLSPLLFFLAGRRNYTKMYSQPGPSLATTPCPTNPPGGLSPSPSPCIACLRSRPRRGGPPPAGRPRWHGCWTGRSSTWRGRTKCGWCSTPSPAPRRHGPSSSPRWRRRRPSWSSSPSRWSPPTPPHRTPPPIPVPRVGLGYHWAILGVWVVHFGQPLLKIRPRCPFWVCC